MTLTRAQRAKSMRSSDGFISSQRSSVNTTKRSSGKAANDNRHKQKQRRTRSGRKVADYYELTSDSFEEEDNKYSLNADDDQNKNQKESITLITTTSKSTNPNQKDVVEKSHENLGDIFDSDHSSEDEQASLQKRLGFPIFTKKFLNYDKSKRSQQQKLERENKLTSIEIDNLREKIQEIKMKSKKTTEESDELQRLNNELTNCIEKTKSSLIRLEREIGPTVRSSGVKLDDTENMVAYINDFRKRIVSGCLLQPE